MRERGFGFFEVVIFVAIVSVLASICVPAWVRGRGQLSSAISRSGDKEDDGNLDYGTLAELSTAACTTGKP